jgi:hypothetical protein
MVENVEDNIILHKNEHVVVSSNHIWSLLINFSNAF